MTHNKPLDLTFAAHITGANEATRQISGLVVPFGKTGNTSAGPVVFELGSINPDPKGVKFLLQHDAQRPIGKAIDFTVTPGGINGTFKVSNTTAGSDALVEAADGLRDGLSVGAQIDKYTIKDGVMRVTAAKIVEVSLVHAPAFADALVTDVAAQEAVADDSDTQEETVSEQPIETVEVEEVEAAAAPTQVTAAAPVFTKPRIEITAAGYIENSIKALTGDDSARQYVRAADDSTSTNTGLTLPQHLQEFVTNTIADRPAVDAVSRQALVSSGMTFTVPKLTTAPTVAATSEGSAPSETGMTSNYLTGTVVKYAGSNDVSWELIDRSSPEFYAELLVQMQNAYAKATDEAVLSALASSGTQASTTAATAAGFISYVGTESAACFAGSKKKARNVVINTDWWGTLLGATDSTGRPLFTASNAQNNPGVVGPQSIDGNIMGLNVYVDPYVAAATKIDDSAFIIAPEAVTWYEAPTTRLQVQIIETGQVRVGVYGYGSVLVKQAEGIRRFNLT